MSAVNITKENFREEVLQSDLPVLLDFWAGWCGPCRMVSPVVEEIARERPDVKVGKINIDEQRELAEQFQIMSIPTLMVVRDGRVVRQAVGARPKNRILAMLGEEKGHLRRRGGRAGPSPESDQGLNLLFCKAAGDKLERIG